MLKPLKIDATLTSLSRGSSKSFMVDYEINLRAILGAFMVGTGSSDVAKVITTMGIGGGASFERQFIVWVVSFTNEFFGDAGRSS